jgi:hypothetical protein
MFDCNGSQLCGSQHVDIQAEQNCVCVCVCADTYFWFDPPFTAPLLWSPTTVCVCRCPMPTLSRRTDSEHSAFTVLLRKFSCRTRRGICWVVFRNSSEKKWLIGDYLISISRHPFCKPYNILGRLRFAGTYCLHHHGRRVSWTRNEEGEGAKRTSACHLAYSSTLKMETLRSLNTLVSLVSVCQITERSNPETSTHPTYHFQDAKCNKTFYYLQFYSLLLFLFTLLTLYSDYYL